MAVRLSPGEEDDDESYVQLRLLVAVAVFCFVSAFDFVAPPSCDSGAGVDRDVRLVTPHDQRESSSVPPNVPNERLCESSLQATKEQRRTLPRRSTPSPRNDRLYSLQP